jgi:hypothetical protein
MSSLPDRRTTRQDKTRQDKTRQDKTRQDKTRQDKTRQPPIILYQIDRLPASALWFCKASLLYAAKSARWLNSALTHVLFLWLCLGSTLAYGQNVASFTPTISADGSLTCAIKNDGALTCWFGSTLSDEAILPKGNFSQVSISLYHGCAVKTDNTLACWGKNDYGQATPPNAQFLQVSVGSDHSCGLKTDGAIVCWGDNQYGQATPPAGNFLQVDAGGLSTCAIKNDNTVVCWGNNAIFTPAPDTFSQISAGLWGTCGVKKNDNTLACWGTQDTPPSGTFSAVDVGLFHNCAIRTDGTLACWGTTNDFGQATPPSGTFSQVTTGMSHTCGVKTDGTVACWGDNTFAPAITVLMGSGEINIPGQVPTANQLPVANFTVTPPQGEAPLTATLDAGSSNDPDGTISKYEWSMNGHTLTVTGKSFSVTLETAGDYPVTLTVTDDKGTTATKTLSITVSQPVVTNQPPTADYQASPNSGQAPLTTTLDASPSSDSDGSIVSYQWSVNGQTLSGKTVSVTLDKAGDYPIILTVTDDKGASTTIRTTTVTVSQPTQSSSEFCTSGNVNVDWTHITNCSNGSCSTPGIKITCNKQSCQWCDAGNNCGNILYTGVTSIPGGSINCTNGQCSYGIQAGGTSLNDNFNCQVGSSSTSQPITVDTTPTIKVEAVNPVVSKSIYQDGDQVKITIPKTLPTGQSQYFGIDLPNNRGLFLVKNLNEFYPFDGLTLLEWQGGDTAIDVFVTPDLPRGKYTTYLLRSLKGVNPLKAGENQTALGENGFIIMDNKGVVNPSTGKASTPIATVTQITDVQTDLGIVVSNVDQKELLTIRGGKNSQGNLTSITNITYVAKDDPSKSVNFNLGDGVTKQLTIELSDGTKVKFENHDPVKKTADMILVETDDKGNETEVAKLEKQPIYQLDIANCFKTADLSDMVSVCVLNGAYSLINEIAATACGVSESAASSGGLNPFQGTLSKLIIGVSNFVLHLKGVKGSVCKPISDVPELGTETENEGPATTCYTDPLNSWPEASLALAECLKANPNLVSCGHLLVESASNLFSSIHKMMSQECLPKAAHTMMQHGIPDNTQTMSLTVKDRCYGGPTGSHGNYVTIKENGVEWEVKDGEWIYGNNDGSFSVGTYSKGIANGYAGSWESNCKPNGWHGNYVNGKMNGLWIGVRAYPISDAGSFQTTTYVNDIKQGPHGEWNADGTARRCHGNYVNDLPDGMWYCYDYEGKPSGWSGKYVNGKKDGVWFGVMPYDDGNFDSITYANDVKQGPFGQWKADGTARGCHGNYANDKKIGVWTCYKYDGTTYTETYVEGVKQ